ncbi:MAG: prepilin-type N-terminal cleavage/methylation domain-containing protein [Candidatus Eisenbacteria sp.]|nr:prepilin-type N-terminal cleavage/methylation domain-containing protein [Candidatus Eisenbacteria bacterium]
MRREGISRDAGEAMKLASLRRTLPRTLPTNATAGFTLVELMIALAVLGIGIMAAGRLFVFAQHHASYGREETMAVSLSQEIREKILSDNYDDIVSIFDNVDTDDPGSIPTPCQIWATHVTEGLGSAGRGTVEVFDDAQDPEISDGMLTILITISWLEDGHTQALEMRFSISKMGI